MVDHDDVSTLRAIAGDASVSIVDAVARIDASGLQDTDFESSQCRALFAGMLATLRNGRPLDVPALAHAVGSAAPRKLVELVVMDFELGVSARRLEVVREKSKRRKLVHALSTLLDQARSEMTYADVHGEALKKLAALDTPAAQLRSLDGEVMGLIEELEAVATGRAQPTLTTGIAALDKAIGGLQPTLTILGAEPGAGKSALMARIVRNIAERGIKVGVFSLEDQSRWMVRRMLSESSAVPVFVLQNRPLGLSQRERVQDTVAGIHALAQNIIVEDRKGLTAADVAAGARVMVASHGVEAIFVDHLGEIRVNRTDRHDRDIGDALRELRAIADVHRVPIVVLCHVKRRDGVGEEPRLTDFAFSADVERTARVALALVKPGEDRQGVHVLKQTQGASGVVVRLRFNAPAAMTTNEEMP